MSDTIITTVMHKIRALLYPNFFPGYEGTFIARTKTDATLSVEEVCIAATTRGKADHSYEVMLSCVLSYLEEVLYQLSDGFSVGNKVCSIHPKLGGVFNKLGALIKPIKRRVDFGFRAGSALHTVSDEVEVVIEGVADTNGYIGRATDIDSETFDDLLTPGGNLIIEGHKIKVGGTEPNVGLYFVDTAGVRMKVAKHFAENRDAKVIAVVPDTLTAGTYRLEIVTQYSHGTLLKDVRTITYDVDLMVN